MGRSLNLNLWQSVSPWGQHKSTLPKEPLSRWVWLCSISWTLLRGNDITCVSSFRSLAYTVLVFVGCVHSVGCGPYNALIVARPHTFLIFSVWRQPSITCQGWFSVFYKNGNSTIKTGDIPSTIYAATNYLCAFFWVKPWLLAWCHSFFQASLEGCSRWAQLTFNTIIFFFSTKFGKENPCKFLSFPQF